MARNQDHVDKDQDQNGLNRNLKATGDMILELSTRQANQDAADLRAAEAEAEGK